MVWCPIHNIYLKGKKAKEEHAHDGYKSCGWMENYIYNLKRKQ